jgi:hypothetical protein
MHGFIDDAGVFTTIDVAGAAVTAVKGINDQGQIVGFFVQAGTLTAVGDTIGFVGTPTSPPGSVREPSSALLAFAGLAAAWTALKRRPQA